MFYLHGNRGDLNTWTTGLDFYRRINYDLFILDYRGYGKSTGKHRKRSATARGRACRLGRRRAALPRRCRSSSSAARSARAWRRALARDVHPALVVLVTPFANLAAAAKRRYPMAPEFLLKYPLRTDAVIGDVRSPCC